MLVDKCLLAAFGDGDPPARTWRTNVPDDEIVETRTVVIRALRFVFGRRSAEIYDTPYSFSLVQKGIGWIVYSPSLKQSPCIIVARRILWLQLTKRSF